MNNLPEPSSPLSVPPSSPTRPSFNSLSSVHSNFSRDDGDDDDTPRVARQKATRNSSDQEKTNEILEHMRRLKLSFGAFVEEAVKKDAQYKSQLSHRPELLRSVYSDKVALNVFDNGHRLYRTELQSMGRCNYFRTWKAGDVEPFKTSSETVIREMENRAPSLMSLFRAIARAEDDRSRRVDIHNRWISIMAILCYTYMPRTCTLWPTLWGIQLHANGCPRRVIDSLYHTGITVGYKAVMTAFTSLSKIQDVRLRELGLAGDFIVVWDNFEQIMSVKDQRMDNQKEFFSVTTAQILKPTWMPDGGLRQTMFDRSVKLNWMDIVQHSSFSRNSELNRMVKIELLFL